MKSFRWLFVGFTIYLAAGAARGLDQSAAQANALEITSAQLTPNLASPGSTTDLVLKLRIQPPFKAYLDKIFIRKKQDRYFSVGEPEMTPVISFEDPVTKEKKFGAVGDITLKAPVQISRDLGPGVFHEKLILSYQLCTHTYCLFPSEKEFDVDFENASGPALPAAFSLSQILFFFFAGFLAALSPCLLPILPITALIVSQKTRSASRGQKTIALGVFIVGLAFSYSLLGVAAGYWGTLFGSQFSSSYFIAFTATLFFVLGLATLGWFEIQLPASWQAQLHRLGGERGGFVGVFLMGFSSGLVASPCVSPVLVGLLGEVSRLHDPLRGFLSLFIFSLGMGLVLLLFGVFFERFKRRLQTNFIQDILGLALLGTSFYYVTLISGLTGPAGHIICLVLFSSALLLRWKKALTVSRLSRIIWLIGFICLEVLYMRAPLKHATWNPAEFARALQSHRSVIVDVRADWCSACRELEAQTFSDSRIRSRLGNSTFLTLDATEPSESLSDFQQKYEIRGLPTVLFFDQNGLHRPELTLTKFESADDFAKRLDRIDSK